MLLPQYGIFVGLSAGKQKNPQTNNQTQILPSWSQVSVGSRRLLNALVVFQRTAGSSSDGTEDSDFSADLEHAEASESVRRRSSTRLTRASLRLSQSSQGKHGSFKHNTVHGKEYFLINIVTFCKVFTCINVNLLK